MNKKSEILKALKAAFPHTIPVLTGYSLLGMAYGVYMNSRGFSFLYPLIMSITIFGGSLHCNCTQILTK